MKKYNSVLKYILVMITALFITGCVHDDKYGDPDLTGYECKTASYYTDPKNGFTKWTLHDLKLKPQNVAIAENAYVEAYVSSSDETGNIYKTLYVQDAPVNPTDGLTVSLDAVSLYTKFPQGSKVYIQVKDLAITTYGGVKQLGMITPAGTRVPEKEIKNRIFRDCEIRENIIPKVMTMSDMVTLNDDFIGCLIQINNVEFDARALCTQFAPNGVTVDKTIGEGWDSVNKKYLKTAAVRNSGFASFANQIVPAGKGKFVGIFSKFNSNYQMYINRVTDLDMEGDKDGDGVDEHFARLDGLTSNPCQFSANGLTVKTIAEVKQLNTAANWTEITGDFYIKAQVVANDATNNLYKYVYVEDATGGIRVNMNKLDLFLDNRFRLGKDVYIKLKGLYLKDVNGEIQIGGLFKNTSGIEQFGQVEEANMYKSFFDTNTVTRPVVATERTITSLTTADVGRWIKIKDLQFIDGDLGKTYASGNSPTNRTLEDCNGNKILLRTSVQADFGTNTDPRKATVTEIEGGKGDVYAIASIFNGTYQLWITRLSDIDLDNPRCDGSIYTPLPVLYKDDFAAGGFSTDWITVNVAGAQVWATSNQGNQSNYYAMVNGVLNNTNEDWLISKSISLVGKTKAAISFTSDVRYSGPALQVYATENYTGSPATTTWVALPAILDTNTGGFGDWVSSGNLDLSAFLGKNVRIAFKYTSTPSAAATWEIDDFKIKGQ
ncbi:DUF5689 domain-containing protein [Chryseobacterium sp. LC2016-29]|uniref:DUF5689 domain-containing protein n=1 Tax=Chryseobacterium sp. LC2016-29 TaxID=2897331 RepID=UPI001E3E9D2A|nr:DUF5689 domain-containing protein [Chryseobacterium sp. LC2016-29]MCD0478556.1 DUF5689 domain-containing protein [Chryseobacterium sp. LC2016-29]